MADPGSGSHGNRRHGNILTTLGECACPGNHQGAVAVRNDRHDGAAREADLLRARACVSTVGYHGNGAGRVDGNTVRGVCL